MKIKDSELRADERAIFRLRDLYSRYGYRRYQMSQFEEYDLYVRNKSFLLSDRIITFTDAGGRLMALKPDVTLSIVKSGRDGDSAPQKVYYSENVYRVEKGSDAFREIMQVGLEYIGDIDSYALFEVLMLAAESLREISEDFVLDISHLGILSSVLDKMGVPRDERQDYLRCVGEKNLHEIETLAAARGLDATPLTRLVATYGCPQTVISAISELPMTEEGARALTELRELTEALATLGLGERVRLDFSVINDMNYYNGIVFRGFVRGVAAGVLSGGRYDNLLEKMGRRAGAVGFAVYPDLLGDLEPAPTATDADCVLLYGEGADTAALAAAVRGLADGGERVLALRCLPDGLTYKRLLRLEGSEVTCLA